VADDKRISSAAATLHWHRGPFHVGHRGGTTPPATRWTPSSSPASASLAKGLENKRENTQVIESIVAEDIGKLPDNNVDRGLQRVTGVQITQPRRR
jgi:hypothetical protein